MVSFQKCVCFIFPLAMEHMPNMLLKPFLELGFFFFFFTPHPSSTFTTAYCKAITQKIFIKGWDG